MLRRVRQMKHEVTAADGAINRIPAANVLDQDLDLRLHSGKTAWISAALREERVEDTHFRPERDEVSCQGAANEAHASGDQDPSAAVLRLGHSKGDSRR